MSDSLEFRLLRYIIAVAETSNFTRAAERLFLAQPSLSRQIRDLEDDIGFAIFDRTRDGVKITPAGEMVIAYAREVLKSREELIKMAKAVHHGIVPPLRLGFSSFVNSHLLQSFRETYEGIFPACQINLASGEAVSILARLDRSDLDCAILPMPIDTEHYQVQQISQSPLALCLRSDDSSAQRNQVDIHEVADRIRIFRDPELQPSAHTRLVEMFKEVGIPLDLACSAATPSDMQWMVKEGYGLALIDQTTPLEKGLTTRPIAGVNWTVDTAFVCSSRADHIALPFIERALSQNWRSHYRKRPVRSVRPEQLELLVETSQ